MSPAVDTIAVGTDQGNVHLVEFATRQETVFDTSRDSKVAL
jgi:hypothetical protein